MNTRRASNPRPASNTKRGGHTLVELLIGAALMLLLVGITVSLWRLTSSVFLKTDRKAKLLGDLQVVSVSLRKAASQSSRQSFSFLDDPSVSAVSFLSARTPRVSGDQVVLAPGFQLEWQKYDGYYLKKASGEVFSFEVPLVPSSPQMTAPTPIENYDPGTGPRPLANYCTGGRRLCDGVDTFSGSWQDGSVVVKLSGIGSDPRALREERLGWSLLIEPRN